MISYYMVQLDLQANWCVGQTAVNPRVLIFTVLYCEIAKIISNELNHNSLCPPLVIFVGRQLTLPYCQVINYIKSQLRRDGLNLKFAIAGRNMQRLQEAKVRSLCYLRLPGLHT